ncbi:helix-turn-helix transcriptional regulator [Gemmobacter nectariphilus]|uniref:helix-turn-helix transcriptional regulator n=1 Tax=Gemmobacter nectariphilus TaxID=220343 RepID=UPI0003F76A5F|nr:helix-turn-helix transcriptional regulator [Gemmobacter nectariphilus]
MTRKGRLQPAALAAILAVQGVAAVFFVGDALADLRAGPAAPHSVFEALVVVALVLGMGVGAWQLRVALDRLRVQDRALATARGTLAQVIESQFTRWGLTPAERDVGFLALKGLDVSEIAGVRGVADGTVRAQLTRIYAKAGVSGRAQFAAWFVEDLLDEGLPAPASHTAPLSAQEGASALAPGHRSD